MENPVGGPTGLIHLAVSIMAMATGLFVLVSTKGTKKHKRVGYIYSFSMLLLNLTALLIYRLYGRFGIFHWFAVASTLTLLGGLYPVLTRTSKNYLLTHFKFMYWSVIGLYCAFMAEVFSRLPKIVLTETGEPMTFFYKFAGIGTAIVMAIGVFFYIKYRPLWTRQLERKKKTNAQTNL
jgi:uncharacterized membrane protein